MTFAPSHTPQSSKSIKGIWLSHVGNAFLTYTTLTDNVFHQLSRLNYNRVYVDVYNNGTTYSSKYAPRNYLLSFPFTNPLKTAIKEGKRQGLKIYAWYEHGLMTFPDAKLAQKHPDWILTTSNQEKLIDNHWWLNPANPEVQQYFVNLFTEVAASYPDIDGIQVDDHWGIPIQFGNHIDEMTELTQKVVRAVRKVRPELVISLSPNPLGFSRTKYSQDWLAWIQAGLIDELVMQLYRQTSHEVALSIDNSILPEVSKYVNVAVGIYAGSWHNQKSLAEIQRQISVVKQYGYGYAIFAWKTSFGILRFANRREKETYLKAI
ncbi:glycoside hydrolase family 10 protein [Pleurocapsa sp. PCC 7319]|uniref:glycoside hydrolase family 10 protein n=1 Tax=Pleurocapsa sp. PCC 7319 TaxID=118161 RepID=UPI00192CB544|nr:family 10 glycosylhydrolase [Pleurocapsa sp. PCC 7319]